MRLGRGSRSEQRPDHVRGAERPSALLALGDDRPGLGGPVEGGQRGHDLLTPGNRGRVRQPHRLEVLADCEQVLGTVLEFALGEAQRAADFERHGGHRDHAERRREVPRLGELAGLVERPPGDQRRQQVAIAAHAAATPGGPGRCRSPCGPAPRSRSGDPRGDRCPPASSRGSWRRARARLDRALSQPRAVASRAASQRPLQASTRHAIPGTAPRPAHGGGGIDAASSAPRRPGRRPGNGRTRATGARGARRGCAVARPRDRCRDSRRVVRAATDVERLRAESEASASSVWSVLVRRDRLDQLAEPMDGALEVPAVEVDPGGVLERLEAKLRVAGALGDRYEDLRGLERIRPPGRAPELIGHGELVVGPLGEGSLQVATRGVGAPAAVASRAAPGAGRPPTGPRSGRRPSGAGRPRPARRLSG